MTVSHLDTSTAQWCILKILCLKKVQNTRHKIGTLPRFSEPKPSLKIVLWHRPSVQVSLSSSMSRDIVEQGTISIGQLGQQAPSFGIILAYLETTA